MDPYFEAQITFESPYGKHMAKGQKWIEKLSAAEMTEAQTEALLVAEKLLQHISRIKIHDVIVKRVTEEATVNYAAE